MKRVRELDSDGEPVEADEPKRRRQLTPNDEERSEVEDAGVEARADESDEESEEADEDMEDQDDLDAPELIDMHRRNGFAFSGVLESVRLDRFMSHDCFEYKLGPNVNIINGPNGSGKSAIVAAVQIGLGARSSATERAASLDEHIMFGKPNAIITIRIRNRVNPAESAFTSEHEGGRGSDSDDSSPSRGNGVKDASTYRHDLYGDCIIIERTLRRGAQGSWRILNSSRKNIVPHLQGITARREVMNICDHFGFMVDNPVAILTQTATKKFLAQCRPTDHWELFQKATLLGPLTDELFKTHQVCQQVELILQQKRNNLPAVTKQLEELEAAWEESKEMKTLGSRIRDMEILHVWTLVLEEEEILQKMEETTKNVFEVDLANILAKEKKLLKSVDEAQTFMDSGDDDLKSATEAASEAKKALNKCLTQHEARKKELSRRDSELRSLERELEERQSEAQAAVDRLDSARKTHVQGKESKAHIAADLDRVASDLEAAAATCSSAEAEHFRAVEERKKLTEDKSALETRFESAKSAFEQKRREAAQQRRSLGNANYVGRFGQDMEKILQAVERLANQEAFHYRPIGPLGQYISLVDDSWAPTIQQAIGFRTLRTIFVGDQHDMNLLQRIFGQIGAKCPITVINGGLGRTPRHNVVSGKAQVQQFGFATVLDLVNVSNDDVFNSLVDGSQIEGAVLIESEHAMSDFSAKGYENVVKCWDRAGNQGYSRNGSHVIRPSERRRSEGSVLSANRESLVQGLEEEANNLYEDVRALEQEKQDIRRLERQVLGAEQNANKALVNARRKHDRLLERRGDLEQQIEEAAAEFDAAPFENDIRENQDLVEEVEVRIKNAEDGRPGLLENIASAEAARKEAKARHVECAKVASECASRMASLTNSVSRDKAALRRVHPEKSKFQSKVKRAHTEILAKRSELAECMENARAMCPTRPKDDLGSKSSEKIMSEIRAMRARLDAEEARRDGKTAQDIEREFLVATKKFKENEQVMNRIKGYHNSLEKGLDRRKREKKSLEQVIKKIVATNFNLFLGTRGHRGTIKFKKNRDTHKSELVISTQMAAHKTGDGGLYKTKDLRSLSGGERSYTTLCFMLSLAEVCQNPVRVMDEPDVFMDEASRNAAFKSLINFCSTTLSDRQIILVTPLTMPQGVVPTDAVRIVKLKQIDRGRALQGSGTQARIDDFANAR